jgi:hypothetical protein
MMSSISLGMQPWISISLILPKAPCHSPYGLQPLWLTCFDIPDLALSRGEECGDCLPTPAKSTDSMH